MTPPAHRLLRVLLVEDEPANRALVRAILERSGPPLVQLHEAESIAAAEASLDAVPIDVVLVDVRLPDGNGLHLVGRLRERFGDAVRLVVVSASVLPHERADALRTGADAFLAKPFTGGELFDALSSGD